MQRPQPPAAARSDRRTTSGGGGPGGPGGHGGGRDISRRPSHHAAKASAVCDFDQKLERSAMETHDAIGAAGSTSDMSASVSMMSGRGAENGAVAVQVNPSRLPNMAVIPRGGRSHDDNHERCHQPKGVVPKLMPVVMLPRKLTKAKESVLFLDCVESIEIREVLEHDDEALYYIMDVYLFREQVRIPTNRHKSPRAPRLVRRDSLRPRKPDFQVARRYSEFEALRTRVWEAAQRPHQQRCEYCDEFLRFMLFSRSQPSLRVKFTTGPKKRMGILERFINELVGVTQAQRPRCLATCTGFELMPILVRRFLECNRTVLAE